MSTVVSHKNRQRHVRGGMLGCLEAGKYFASKNDYIAPENTCFWDL